MNFYKCRVCLKLNPLQHMKSLCMNVKDHGISTVHDMLLFCIPQLLHSLRKSDFICTPCLDSLIDCVKFIKLCLQSDHYINKELLENTETEEFEEDKKVFVILDTVNNGATDSDDPLNTEIVFCHSEEESLDSKTKLHETTQSQEKADIDTSIEQNKTIEEIKNDEKEKTPDTTEDNESQQDKCQLKLLLEGKHPTHKSKPRLKNRLKNIVKTAKNQRQSRVRNLDAKSYTCKLGCGKKIMKDQQSQHVCKFTCMKCKMRFDCKIELEKHVMENMHVEDCETLCSHCSISILSKDFEEHLKSHPTIMCEICSKCFTSVTSLRAHRIVHNEKTEKCPECELSFKCKGALRAHLNYFHKRKEKEVLCDLCPKKFYTNSKLTIHKRRHHFQIRNAACPKCGKLFNNQKAVDYHDRLVHLKLKPFSCEHCDRPFGRKDYMLNHAKICSQSSARKDSSSTRTRRRDTSYKHIKPSQPVECVYCHKVLRNINNLKIHIRCVHTKAPRKHKCEVCGLQFAAKANLVKHELIHNDPNSKYRCDVCYKKYKCYDELQDHVSQKHKKKPYKCDVCGEKFCRKFIMENHRYAVHPNAPNNATAEEKTQEILEEAIRRLESVDNV